MYILILLIISLLIVSCLKFIKGKMNAIEYRSFARSNEKRGYSEFGNFNNERFNEIEYLKSENYKLTKRITELENELKKFHN